MKQLFVTLMIFAITAIGVQAQEKSGPAFKFKGGDTHDFGTLKEGPTADYTFEFTNTGNAPLIINKAVASCGCTVPEWPKDPILPGKTGKMKVTYTTKGHVTPFMKEISIFSNAVNNPKGEKVYTLYIKGTVVAAEDPAIKANQPKAKL
jgi:hypothetical protein